MRWPQRAMEALRGLFEPLQDIDVYVEDENDEVFYTKLLARLAGNEFKLVRVFSKKGRADVIAAARTHDFTIRRALFLIDGDLEWVAGKPAPNLTGLYRLEAYCIENFLICKLAAEQVLMEEMVLDAPAAAAALDFKGWTSAIEAPLVRLFSAYAVVSLLKPQSQTVAAGVTKMLTDHALDPSKAEAARLRALAEAATAAPQAQVERLDAEIRTRAAALPAPLRVVSGKAFLLPLLDLRLRGEKCKVRRHSLRFRLAGHCDIGPLDGLRSAMRRAARA